MIEVVNKVIYTSGKMLNEIGREPTPEELAEKLGMPLEKVRKVLNALHRDAGRRRGGCASWRPHRGQERDPAHRRRDPVEPARDDNARACVSDAARGAHSAHALRHRYEQGPHARVGRSAVFGDARAHQADRGQGAAEVEAPEPVKDSQKLPRQWMRRGTDTLRAGAWAGTLCDSVT